MDGSHKPSENQADHLPVSREASVEQNLHFKDDVKSRARPKTSINAEEAKQYNNEGLEGSDVDDSTEIFYTSEVKLHVSDNEKSINEFKIMRTIGKGAYSKVKHVIRSFTEQNEVCEEEYAMKMIHKPTLRRERWAIYDKDGKFEISNALEKVYSEIEVWSQVHHSSIVKLFEFIEADGHDYIYLIIEFCDLGQISRWDFTQEIYVRNEQILEHFWQVYLSDREFDNENQIVEEVAKIMFKDVVEAVSYLHSKNIVHRDIKPDNILICSQDSKAKISDFSVSCKLDTPEDRMYNWEGTVAFTAPESHVPESNGFLVLPTDIWSIGVTMYTFLSQNVPFYAESELEMQINAQKKDPAHLPEFSDSWNDLLLLMLNKDPLKRITAAEILAHPWFE